MARGTVVGEAIVSQANTPEYRENHERIFGDRKPVRGRWVYDAKQGKCIPADDYHPEPVALNAPIIADRIHEGTTIDVGDRVVDIGSRAKRRAFMRETGLADASDCSKQWFESRGKAREREAERRIDASAEQAARKLYQQGKIRD